MCPITTVSVHRRNKHRRSQGVHGVQVHPRAKKSFFGLIKGLSCKWTTAERVKKRVWVDNLGEGVSLYTEDDD